METGKPAHTKAIIFEWEIPSVFLSQDPAETQRDVKLRDEVSSFVILTGSDTVFEASTCAKCLEEHFGEAGHEALNFVVTILEHGELLDTSADVDAAFQGSVIPPGKGEGKYRLERVSRSSVVLTTQAAAFPSEFVAAMKWLCEAVRPIPETSQTQPNHHPLLLKSRGLRVLELGTGESKAIVGFSLGPLQQMTDEEIGRGCCWTKLFESAVVAWKPLKHSWGTGLKLPYEMLVRLAAVTNYSWINHQNSTGQLEETKSGGLIALGFFTALIPVAQDPDKTSIQWHLESIDITDKSRMDLGQVETTKGNWIKISDEGLFPQCECFLGWREKVNILLGTRKGQYGLKWTTSKKLEKVPHLDQFTIGGVVGFGNIIPITLQGTFNFTFKRCSTVQPFNLTAPYDLAVSNLSRHVALIYDSASMIAWLVPQLSWTLHLCHVWYQRFASDQASDNPVPFAELSTDGRSAALKALLTRGGSPIISGLTLSQLLLHIVTMNKGREKPKGSRIYGSETMDLIEQPGNGSPSENCNCRRQVVRGIV